MSMRRRKTSRSLPARGQAPSRKEVSAYLVWNAIATFKIGGVKRGYYAGSRDNLDEY